VTREAYRNGRLIENDLVASNLPTAPNNVGPKTFPDYDKVANQAIRIGPVRIGKTQAPVNDSYGHRQ